MLLHGIPLSSLTWRHNMAALGQSFSVFAIDLKGFGGSTYTISGFTPECHARAIQSVLDTLGLPSVNVVANSYGCAIAASLTSMDPQRVKRMILIGSIGTGEGRHHLERLLRIGVFSALARPILSSFAGGLVVTSRLKAAYCHVPADVDNLAAQYVQPLQSIAGATAFLESLRSLHEPTVWLQLNRIPNPVLLVWGGLDPLVPVRGGMKLQVSMSPAQLEVFEQSGHFPHEEEPERWNRMATDFLQNEVGREVSRCSCTRG